ncbi:MAG: AraC family transcriptional regulator [Maribacter sp.]
MGQNLDFNFQVILDSIGLIHGVTLGVLLIILNRRKYRSSLFLGLFLVFFSLELAMFISIDSQVSERYPKLYLLPFNFSWLLFPLFFIYTQQVSVLSKDKTKYWLLYPGIASFLIQVAIFCLPYETKQVIYLNKWYDLFIWVFGSYYSWIIGIWNLRLLYRHRIEVKNTYSYVTFKELQWARIILIYLLSISVFTHLLSYGYAKLFHYKVYLSIIDIIAIYWISYFGIVQRNISSVLTNKLYTHNLQDNSIEQKESTIIEPNKLEEIMLKINDHMTRFESFTNMDLTIADLANDLKLHPKPVSTAINSRSQQNFNSYVNQFRIEKAKSLLAKEKMENLSIEGIGKEVGFHSKSAFYAAFRKETGTTPTKFIEQSKLN